MPCRAFTGCWPTPEEYIPSGLDRVRVDLFTLVTMKPMIWTTEARRGLLIFGAVFLLSQALFSQQPVTKKDCALTSFSRELNAAIKERDAAKVALMVVYPLRVNDERGSYYIKDAESLQGRFTDIFTPAVEEAIASQKVESSNCGPPRFMYGSGDVWVALTEQGYAIETVNLPGKDDKRNTSGHVRVTCRTAGYRIIVDVGGSGTLRLRAWQKGQSLMQKPDIELHDGKESIEGTGACAYPVWSFNDGGKRLSIEGLGCFGDSQSPPPNATGQFIASTGATSWCF